MMKKITLAGLVSLAILSGGALAVETGDEKKGPSTMQGMMQEMMREERTSESGMGGMMGMMNMMGEMGKMMDQCATMMESMHASSGEAKEGQKR